MLNQGLPYFIDSYTTVAFVLGVIKNKCLAKMGQKINNPVLIIATVYAQEIWQRPGLNNPDGPQYVSTNSLLNPNGKRTRLTVIQITAKQRKWLLFNYIDVCIDRNMEIRGAYHE